MSAYPPILSKLSNISIKDFYGFKSFVAFLKDHRWCMEYKLNVTIERDNSNLGETVEACTDTSEEDTVDSSLEAHKEINNRISCTFNFSVAINFKVNFLN